MTGVVVSCYYTDPVPVPVPAPVRVRVRVRVTVSARARCTLYHVDICYR